jgi:hypothetical protein
MPKFTFTSPEGKTYDVEGPDGSTKEQAFGILQQKLSAAPPPGPAAQIPSTNATAPKPRLAPAPDTGAPRTGGDVLTGLGETALTVGSAIPAGLAGQVKGIAQGVTGGKYGTQAGVAQAADVANKFTKEHTYEPRTAAGQEYTQRLGSAFDESKLAGLSPEVAMGQLPKVPRAVNLGAEALSEGASKTGKTLSKAALSTLPAIDPETRALAREAHSMGFRLRPDQVYGSKYGKIAGELSSHVPFSGSAIDSNQAVFNRNVLKTIGGEGDKLTRQAYNAAMKKSGSTIGDIAEKTNIPLNSDFIGALRQNAQEAASYQTSDVAKVVNSYIDEIISKSEKGVLPGKTLRVINTKLGNQIRSTANGDLKYALGDMQDVIQDAMKANLSKEDLAALTTARRQYAAGKTLESLVAKSPTGDIPPSALLGAITGTKAGKSLAAKGAAGDLGKLADIGQRFLKEPASSGTAERNLVQKGFNTLAGLGGAYMLPSSATVPGVAALYGGANLYNRLGPKLTNRLLERPPEP